MQLRSLGPEGKQTSSVTINLVVYQLMIEILFYSNRWRDVKLRSFDDASHRTYVDLKVYNTLNLSHYKL